MLDVLPNEIQHRLNRIQVRAFVKIKRTSKVMRCAIGHIELIVGCGISFDEVLKPIGISAWAIDLLLIDSGRFCRMLEYEGACIFGQCRQQSIGAYPEITEMESGIELWKVYVFPTWVGVS